MYKIPSIPRYDRSIQIFIVLANELHEAYPSWVTQLLKKFIAFYGTRMLITALI
jgi:polyhydroxyalkanoate synthesis regulator protein